MTALPRGLRWLIGHGLDNLDDRTEGFIDFKQGLDRMFRMLGMWTRDILQRGQLRLSDKLPLDNSMTSDETQAT
jgi:hypothetical protein